MDVGQSRRFYRQGYLKIPGVVSAEKVFEMKLHPEILHFVHENSNKWKSSSFVTRKLPEIGMNSGGTGA